MSCSKNPLFLCREVIPCGFQLLLVGCVDKGFDLFFFHGASSFGCEKRIFKSMGFRESKNRPQATNFQFLKILALWDKLLVGACLPQTLLDSKGALSAPMLFLSLLLFQFKLTLLFCFALFTAKCFSHQLVFFSLHLQRLL